MSTQQIDNTSNVVLTLDEYELHDFVAVIRQALSRELGIDDEHSLERIVITPQDTERFPPGLQKKWEHLINEFMRSIGQLDSDYHDDAEYTC